MDMNTGGRENMKGGQQMIYSQIQFQAAPFSYDLRFTDRITLVRGIAQREKPFCISCWKI